MGQHTFIQNSDYVCSARVLVGDQRFQNKEICRPPFKIPYNAKLYAQLIEIIMPPPLEVYFFSMSEKP